MFERPNLGGRVRPWGSHWLRDLPEPIRGARPLTASHGLSLLSCDLSEPIRGARPHTASHGLPNLASQTYKIHRKHGLSRTRPHRFESPIGLSPHTGRESDPRGYLTDFTAKRIASAGVRERPIGLSNV